MEFWQTIAATALGGLITLVAAYMANKHQRQLESNKRKLEKIEYSHSLTLKIEHIYRMLWASDLRSLSSGKYSDEARVKERVPFDELEMLIAFYIPELKPKVAILIKLAQVEYGHIRAKIRNIEETSLQERNALQPVITDKYNEIKLCIQDLQDSLVKIAKSEYLS